jgi:hypothetical protein
VAQVSARLLSRDALPEIEPRKKANMARQFKASEPSGPQKKGGEKGHFRES